MKKVIVIILLIVTSYLITGCDLIEEGVNMKYNYLILVNKYTKLPDDWENNVELVSTKNAWDEDIQVEKEAYKQYKKLEKTLKDEGITIKLDSVYRSVQAQQELWDEWAADPEKGLDYVKKFVAVPGYSEHHTGLAIDICLEKDGKLIYDNDEMIAEIEIFSKIHKKLADYGFILRYLEGKEESTGYTYEPWHLRYVGNKKIAQEIMKNNLTLEEYLANQTNFKTNSAAAIFKIETLLIKEFENSIYKDKITNARFNIKKLYTDEDNVNPTIKSLNLGSKDIAFEVTYQIQPSESTNKDELMIPDGEYDENLGWIKNINRVGILKYNKKDKSYKINNFGTGW